MNLGLGYRCGAVWNESHWCDPEFDALLDEASAIIDIEERRQVMAQIQAHQQEHGTIAVPFWQNQFYAINTRLRNLLPHPSSYLIFTETWLS
jgi:peptide/nickel transport system substrate-binding protein